MKQPFDKIADAIFSAQTLQQLKSTAAMIENATNIPLADKMELRDMISIVRIRNICMRGVPFSRKFILEQMEWELFKNNHS